MNKRKEKKPRLSPNDNTWVALENLMDVLVKLAQEQEVNKQSHSTELREPKIRDPCQ
ncbi:MAG: hypothetical protein OEW82_04170 [Dehalococcoidia bacterium]|nr:hypothetical protein [Dehalococcoidia bacterium]